MLCFLSTAFLKMRSCPTCLRRCPVNRASSSLPPLPVRATLPASHPSPPPDSGAPTPERPRPTEGTLTPSSGASTGSSSPRDTARDPESSSKLRQVGFFCLLIPSFCDVSFQILYPPRLAFGGCLPPGDVCIQEGAGQVQTVHRLRPRGGTGLRRAIKVL